MNDNLPILGLELRCGAVINHSALYSKSLTCDVLHNSCCYSDIGREAVIHMVAVVYSLLKATTKAAKMPPMLNFGTFLHPRFA